MRTPSIVSLAASTRSSLTVAVVLAAAGGCVDGEPPTDPPLPTPSALARCADPAVALEERWLVDNLHDPITAIARTGRTVVVASADGALKVWQTSAAGAAETRPTYGTPIVDEGTALGAIAAGPDGAIAGVDVDGQARLWRVDGSELAPARAMLPAAGSLVAIDYQRRWMVAGTRDFAGDLTIADLDAGTRVGPVQTILWGVTATHLGGDDRWVSAGHWYGCPALELRDPRAPEAALASWDACRDAVGAQHTGWFRALAVDDTATEALVVGDNLLATFTLASLDDGPTALATTDVRLDRVVRLDGDRLAITLAARGDASELTWWSLDDLTARRTVTIPAAVDLVVDAEAGLLVAASADGLLRGYACGE